MPSDQGSRFTSYVWLAFMKANGLISSMSRRGNCQNNAMAESFSQLLTRERIWRKNCDTSATVQQDILDYIGLFHNAERRHGFK